MQEGYILGERDRDDPFTTYTPDDPGLIADLINAAVGIEAQPPATPSGLSRFFATSFPVLLLIAVWIYVMRRQGLGGRSSGGVFGFGKSKAERIEDGAVLVPLSDVAGVDEAKEDVGELVDFLRDPNRYRRLGGSIPRGVLMVGPPRHGQDITRAGHCG